MKISSPPQSPSLEVHHDSLDSDKDRRDSAEKKDNSSDTPAGSTSRSTPKKTTDDPGKEPRDVFNDTNLASVDGLDTSAKRKAPDGSRSPTPSRIIPPPSNPLPVISIQVSKIPNIQKLQLLSKSLPLQHKIPQKRLTSDTLLAAQRMVAYPISGPWQTGRLAEFLVDHKMTLHDILGSQASPAGASFNRPANAVITYNPHLDILLRIPSLTRDLIAFKGRDVLLKKVKDHFDDLMGVDVAKALKVKKTEWHLEAARSLLLAPPSSDIWAGIQTIEMGPVREGAPTMRPVTPRIVKFDSINLIVAIFELKAEIIVTFFPLTSRIKRQETRETMLSLQQLRINNFFSGTVPT